MCTAKFRNNDGAYFMRPSVYRSSTGISIPASSLALSMRNAAKTEIIPIQIINSAKCRPTHTLVVAVLQSESRIAVMRVYSPASKSKCNAHIVISFELAISRQETFRFEGIRFSIDIFVMGHRPTKPPSILAIMTRNNMPQTKHSASRSC